MEIIYERLLLPFVETFSKLLFYVDHVACERISESFAKTLVSSNVLFSLTRSIHFYLSKLFLSFIVQRTFKQETTVVKKLESNSSLSFSLFIRYQRFYNDEFFTLYFDKRNKNKRLNMRTISHTQNLLYRFSQTKFLVSIF